MEKIKAIVITTGKDGCAWFRAVQPHRVLEKMPDSNIVTLTYSNEGIVGDKTNFHEGGEVTMKYADIFFVQMALPTQHASTLMEWRKAYGSKIIFDHDDNMLDIEPSNQGFRHFGWREDVVRSATILNGDVKVSEYKYIDGMDGFSSRLNAWMLQSRLSLASNANIVTTTTDRLAEVFRSMRSPEKKGDVLVFPNCVIPEDYPMIERKPEKKNGKEILRIVFTGGQSHVFDWLTIRDPLDRAVKELSKKYHVQIVFVGLSVPALCKNGAEMIEWGWVDPSAHSFRLACALSPGDIGVCALTGSSFNQYKSEIKFTEFGALGCAVIAKKSIPYSCVLHGKTGMVYDTEEEFYRCVMDLGNNPKRRIALGSRARGWVVANRNALDWAKKRRDLYIRLAEEKYGSKGS